MKKNIFLLVILFIATYNVCMAQSASKSQASNPKLVVGIVVDQMRYDYLSRFWSKYSEGGFKRLVNDGFLLKNANFNYVPTYTAPGHASIYTGTTPSINGIIENDWYDRKTNKKTYCVSDSQVQPVGTDSSSGRMSPGKLLTTTITDELRLSNNFKSKVIAISLKDRGAILPAGHAANAAYWHDKYTNNFVSSSYYVKELPQWVRDFNNRRLVDSLLSKPWTTLLPIEQYTESSSDDTRYEGLFKGESKPIFPHNLPEIKKLDNELIRSTPFGNTFVTEFAKATLNGENLGNAKATDFLAVSFSSPDYIGHMFGTTAIEVEDNYLRLDKDIADFLSFLDKRFGATSYLLFLTADHGGASNVVYNHDHGIPSDTFPEKAMADSLKAYLNKYYEPGDYVWYADAHSIYLNHYLIDGRKISLEEIQNRCIKFLMTQPGVALALAGEELRKGNCKTGVAMYMQNGYNMQRSADVMIELAPGWLDWGYSTGTTHGSAYSYDTHVPLIFYGWKIPKGSSSAPVTITDIAPTISALLNIENPSGCTGTPIPEITGNR
jgi:predicted AlkP superfamily pyrophosphatase or phosphodiesterase